MNPVIFYRDDVDWREEEEFAKKYFKCVKSRMEIQKGDLVIPRFSALPFYKEQEYDINYVGATMINSYRQHRYIADLRNWYEDLKEFTPETWFRVQDIPDEGPFVLKGETNSKKFLWKSHMFAKNKREAIDVESRLLADSVISYQNIYIRRYVQLKTFLVGIQDLPITNEYRFFCYKDKILSSGYYWSSHVDELKSQNIIPDPSCVPRDFLKSIMSRVEEKTNFYVLDVAELQNGDFVLIEINDGSMSGLSENNPDELYRNLKNILNAERTL